MRIFKYVGELPGETYAIEFRDFDLYFHDTEGWTTEETEEGWDDDPWPDDWKQIWP